MDHQAHQMQVKRLKHQMRALTDQKIFLNHQTALKNSEIDRSSDASDAGQETEASDESCNGSEDISGLSDIEYSFDLKTPCFLCPKQTKKMQPKSKESQQDLPARHSRKSAVDTKHFFHGHIRSKRMGSYIVPTESKKVRDEAKERFESSRRS